MVKTLIFDVDGTLAETERDGHRPAFNRAFADAGLDWDWTPELYGKLLMVTGGKERMRHYVETYRPELEVPSKQTLAALHARKTEYYLEILSQGAIPLRPGVLRLLNAARSAGYRLAIATTTSVPNVMALVEQQLAVDWFEVIAAGDIVPAKKPAPDIYLYAMEQMQVSPAECIAFEDSLPGLKSTLAAGLKTIVTVNDYTRHEDFAGAALVLSDLGEPNSPCQTLLGTPPAKGYLDLDDF
jgi:HAD superfamily hydrolase (TIGR01509 family)